MHADAWVMEEPRRGRFLGVRTLGGDHSMTFDEAAALAAALDVALSRYLDPSPLPEPELITPYYRPDAPQPTKLEDLA